MSSVRADAPEAPPSEAPVREREQATRMRILDAAIECFVQYGNEKTTLNDIARVAGLARQTIYRHFPDRAAVLEAVNALEQQRLTEAAAALNERAGSLEAFLAGIVAVQVATALRYRTRQHLIDRDRGLLQSLFLAQDDRAQQLRALVRPALESAVSRGELRDGLDLDGACEWIAITLLSISRVTEAATFDLDDPEAVGTFYATHLCRGLLAPAADHP